MSEQAVILVVDDDAMNREILEAYLGMEDYQVVLASNGQKGLQTAQEQAISLILLDVRLPDMSGYDVCQQIRTDERTGHIPILIVSGYSSKADRQQAFDAGADGFISRPFDGDDLLQQVKTLLNNAGGD